MADPPILGVQACLWTEPVETLEDAELLLFPRLFAHAEARRAGPRELLTALFVVETLRGQVHSHWRVGSSAPPIA